MKCEGKCHLRKQLEKDAKQEQSSSRNVIKEKMDIQFSAALTGFEWNITLDMKKPETKYSFPISIVGLPSIFHPPA